MLNVLSLFIIKRTNKIENLLGPLKMCCCDVVPNCYCNALVLQISHPAVLLWLSAEVLLCCSATVLQCYCALVLLCFGATVLYCLCGLC